MRVLVLHTDPNVCREEHNLQSKLSDSLLSFIKSRGRSPRPPTVIAAAMPPSAAARIAPASGKPEAGITILYQCAKGGSRLKPVALSSEDDRRYIALRAPKDFSVPPGTQCLIALRLRSRIPGGVACFIAPLPPPEEDARLLATTLEATPLPKNFKMQALFGEPMPIDESYYGELFVTIPKVTKEVMIYL